MTAPTHNSKTATGPADEFPGLFWPELVPGTLLRRYKRFLADVELSDGQTVTAHCPNSGSMRQCSEIGRPVYLSVHDSPKRKLKYTWELIEMASGLVGVNTMVPNRLVKRAVEFGQVKPLRPYSRLTSEVRVGTRSRLDLLLEYPDRRKCYVEIKNCTLVENRIAAFPDAATSRGLKHLVELEKLIAAGNRAVIFFLIQRMDAAAFKPAAWIDPAYARALNRAIDRGVELLVYDVRLTLQHIVLNRPIDLVPRAARSAESVIEHGGSS